MKISKLKILVASTLLASLSCVLGFRVMAHYVVSPWEHSGNMRYQFIAHEGGGIDGHTYTSSKEAVNLALSKGFKLIELDLIETSDGKLIGAHDWVQFKEITGQDNKNDAPMSLADAYGLKIHGKYSALYADDIRLLLLNNPDFNLVTDKTNNFELINALGTPERIYVEVFGARNYIKSIFHNIKRPLYSLSIGRWGEVGEYLKILLLDPKYVAASTSTVKSHERLFDWIHARGIKIFIFTSNEPEFIEWAKNKYDATIYTDFWNPLTNTCEATVCKSY